VNRELKQRIRPVNGLTVHRSVAKQDIRHVARVIHVLDSRWNIWSNPDDEKKDEEKEARIVLSDVSLLYVLLCSSYLFASNVLTDTT